jgi:cytochrome c-type biogenesis protein CcmH
MSREGALGFALLWTVLAAVSAHGQADTASMVVSPEAVIGTPAGPPLSGAELDRRTQELASIMRCPVCQALSVADSPTASAIAMREEARDLLAAGYSESQVLEYFEKSYGEFILLAPKKKGLNWLVWLAPIVALLAGGALILGGFGRRSTAISPGESREPEVDDDLAAFAERVRREVAE